jgi:hypothetical protein
VRATSNVRTAGTRLAAHLGVQVEREGGEGWCLTFPSGSQYRSTHWVACVGAMWRWATTAQPAGAGLNADELRAAVRYAATDHSIHTMRRATTHDRRALLALRAQ